MAWSVYSIKLNSHKDSHNNLIPCNKTPLKLHKTIFKNKLEIRYTTF